GQFLHHAPGDEFRRPEICARHAPHNRKGVGRDSSRCGDRPPGRPARGGRARHGGMIVTGADYEHTQNVGLKGGDVEIEYQARPVQEFFDLVMSRGQFEASEFSLANYMMYRGNGDDWLTGVPVFPSRVFRHSHVIVRKDSRLSRFDQLAGRKVGLRDYSQTAAVWIRGLLKAEHGVDWRDIHWVSFEPQRFPQPPAGVALTTTRDDLEDMLIAGDLDALLMWPLRDSRKAATDRALRP